MKKDLNKKPEVALPTIGRCLMIKKMQKGAKKNTD